MRTILLTLSLLLTSGCGGLASRQYLSPSAAAPAGARVKCHYPRHYELGRVGRNLPHRIQVELDDDLVLDVTGCETSLSIWWWGPLLMPVIPCGLFSDEPRRGEVRCWISLVASDVPVDLQRVVLRVGDERREADIRWRSVDDIEDTITAIVRFDARWDEGPLVLEVTALRDGQVFESEVVLRETRSLWTYAFP